MPKLSPWPLLAVAFVCLAIGILVTVNVWKTGGLILVCLGALLAGAARLINGR